jgi:multicomponent Na+:H+ antiporter subunit G
VTVRHIIALVLLVAGVTVIVVSCLGVLVVPGAYQKLHFAAPASSLGGVLVGAGLAVEAAVFTSAFKDVFTVLVLAVTGPVVTTATARAVRARDQRQDVQRRDDRPGEDRPGEAGPTEGRPTEGRHSEGRHIEGRHIEGRHSEGRHSDDRHSDDRHSEPGPG